MATYTRPIPTLRGEDAKIFNKKADEALKTGRMPLFLMNI